jgi:hypothetical protein
MQNILEDYLESTYKRDFEIGRPRFGFSMVEGFNINAACTTTEDGVEIKDEIMYCFDVQPPLQSGNITSEIWSNSAFKDFNRIVNQVYGSNAILTDFFSLQLAFRDDEIKFGDEYESRMYRYKDYLDKEYEYIIGLAKEGKERIAIRITFVVVVVEKINIEEQIEKIKMLKEIVKSNFNQEELLIGIHFVTKKYDLKTYKFMDVDLSEDIPIEYGEEGKLLREQGKLIGHVSAIADESNKFFDKQIKEEFKRITNAE